MFGEISQFIHTLDAGTWSGWSLVVGMFLFIGKQSYDKYKFDKTMKANGFQELVDRLMSECSGLTKSLHDLRLEYDKYRNLCQETEAQLLERAVQQENKIIGLERKVAEQGIEIARLRRRDFRVKED